MNKTIYYFVYVYIYIYVYTTVRQHHFCLLLFTM